MKTIAGKRNLTLVVCASALASLATAAPHVGLKLSRPGLGSERLILLPGPDLLSPARGAPQSSSKVSSTSEFVRLGASAATFHPIGSAPRSQSGVQGKIHGLTKRPATFEAAIPRFDTTLPATPIALPRTLQKSAK